MTATPVSTAPGDRYSRRLMASLAIALALHGVLLLIPVSRWLAGRPGEAGGDFGGSRPSAAQLLGESIFIRTSPPTSNVATVASAPETSPVQESLDPIVTADTPRPTEPVEALDVGDLRVDLVPPAAGATGAAAGSGMELGGSLPPLGGGGGVPIEMALHPEVMVHPDPLTQIVVKRRIEDQVIVQVLVDRDGLVLDSRILRSIPRCPECTASAVTAASRCRFPRPIYDGENV